MLASFIVGRTTDFSVEFQSGAAVLAIAVSCGIGMVFGFVPARRAAHMPDDDSQVGDIILEDGVWLATDVTVMSGVRIGKGSIVTAGSVVFRDIPPNVIATGNPARVAGPIKMDPSPEQTSN